MSGRPHAVYQFRTRDWGTDQAAYDAAKSLFNRFRTESGLTIIDRLSRLSASAGRDDGWFVRLPAAASVTTVVTPGTQWVSLPR